MTRNNYENANVKRTEAGLNREKRTETELTETMGDERTEGEVEFIHDGRRQHCSFSFIVSEARHSDNSKIVTTSDKAFALLLIDNYLEKWKTAAAAGTGLDGEDEADDGQKKATKKTRRQPGKYTEKKQGTRKYGGWSDDGIRQFNSLRMMIKDNRTCPQSKDMEHELLAFYWTRAGLKNTGGDEHI